MKSAICIELPAATLMARSILFFAAAVTAVTYSAALLMIGNKIKPRKVLLIPEVSTIPSIEPTKYSAEKDTTTVTEANKTNATKVVN